MAIDKNLQALAEKLKLRLKRQNSNFNFSPSQIRDEIKKVSTDYANITTEQETLIMDNLIKSHCDLTETEDPTLKLDKQTLDNLTENNQGVTDMNDNNNQQQSALTINSQQSSAITFNDDLDKATEIRRVAAMNSLNITARQSLEAAEAIGNEFADNRQLLIAVTEYIKLEKNKQDNEAMMIIAENMRIINENTEAFTQRGIKFVTESMEHNKSIEREGASAIKGIADAFFKQRHIER